MAKFVLIGGGETALLDRELLSLTGENTARLLLIGIDDRSSLFEHSARFEIDQLTAREMACTDIATAKITAADIVCIGDGDALQWMRLLRRYGIDTMLSAAADKDKVFVGVGEGAIVLCAFGQSCADKITSHRVKGLGLVDLVFCPHIMDKPQRTGWLKAIMKRTPRLTAAALDHAALVIDGDRFRVLSAPEISRARKCYWYKKQYYSDNIKSSEWHPLDKLKSK